VAHHITPVMWSSQLCALGGPRREEQLCLRLLGHITRITDCLERPVAAIRCDRGPVWWPHSRSSGAGQAAFCRWRRRRYVAIIGPILRDFPKEGAGRHISTVAT
jgi:hypothetical protein